jgi:C1A family cysteine protease
MIDIKDRWALQPPAHSQQFLNSVKTVIGNQHRGVILGLNVDSAFQAWTAENPVPWVYDPELYTGAHYLVAVGYDDSEQAVKVRNSWSYFWRSNGYEWISYSNFIDRDCVTSGDIVKSEYQSDVEQYFLGL